MAIGISKHGFQGGVGVGASPRLRPRVYACAIDVLVTTTFLALTLGLVLPIVQVLRFPRSIALALVCVSLLVAAWLAVWVFRRVLYVERCDLANVEAEPIVLGTTTKSRPPPAGSDGLN